MNAGELIAAYRDESFDTATPPFITDDRLRQFASQAEREACRRSHLLVDSTSAFCSVAVPANTPLVELDPLIINVRRCKLSISTYSLSSVRAEEMDRVNPGWESHLGTPTTYVTDYQSGHIRLYPNPQVGSTLTMTVSRLPVADMAADADKPEIRREYHEGLVQWMLYRAYSKQDSDLFDPNKAAKALNEFEKEFGKKASARNERWQADRPMIDTPTIA